MIDINKLIGERIRDLRKSQNLSQEELANKAYISRSFLGEIERGRSSATIDSLEKIATALGITLEELFKNLYPFNSKLNLLIDKINNLDKENLAEMIDFIKIILNWEN